MPKILIVEDDKAISNLLYLNLDLAGYESEQVYSGKDLNVNETRNSLLDKDLRVC